MKINSTHDYSKFKIIGGNRFLNQRHIDNLTKSLKTVNLLESNPIIVNERFEIIDGQHRLYAAAKAKVEVFYVIHEGARLEEVIMLNTLNKNWGLMDYLNSHIQRGKKEYEIIRLFCETYGLSISYALELLTKGDIRSGDSILKFKSGIYQINNLKEAERIANMVIEFKPYTESGAYRSRDFIRVIKRLLKDKNYKHNIMIYKLKQQDKFIKKTGSIKDMLRQFEDIYNFRKRNKIRFF